MLDFMALELYYWCLQIIVYSFEVFTLRNFVLHYSIILVILLLLKMKLTFPPLPLIMLLTGLCLIPLFYKNFQSNQRSFWDSFLVANSS